MEISPMRKLPFVKEQDGLEVARTVNMMIDGYFSNVIRLPKRAAAPVGADVYDGVIAYADGSGWDPGEGEGLYMYYGSAWNRIWGKPFYGSCYGDDIAWVQASAVQNTWYPVSDSDFVDGKLYGFTHDGNGKLTAAYAGIYSITYHLAGEMSAANAHYETTVRINGSEIGPTIHFEAAKANDHFPAAGGGFYAVNANETIEVSIRTRDSGTPTLGVDHLQIGCEWKARS